MKFNPYNVNFANFVEEFYQTPIVERVTLVAIPREPYKQILGPRHQANVNIRYAVPATNDDLSYFRGLFNHGTELLIKDVNDAIKALTINDNDAYSVAQSFMQFGSLMSSIAACFFGNFAEYDMQHLLFAAKAVYHPQVFYDIVQNLGLTEEQKKNAYAGKRLVRQMYAKNVTAPICQAFGNALLQSISDLAKDNEITIMEERELISYVKGLVK